MLIPLLLVALGTFMINIPFGFWRQGSRKFSVSWILAIHLPVPIVVLLRLRTGLGFVWYTYPIIFAAYFSGQYVGSRLRRLQH